MKIQNEFENEKTRKEQDRIQRITKQMQDYKESVEHQKFEIFKKKDLVKKERELGTSLDINSEKKVDNFKNYINKLNDNIDKNMQNYRQYIEQSKKQGKIYSPSKIYNIVNNYQTNENRNNTMKESNTPNILRNKSVDFLVNRNGMNYSNNAIEMNKEEPNYNSFKNNPNNFINKEYNEKCLDYYIRNNNLNSQNDVTNQIPKINQIQNQNNNYSSSFNSKSNSNYINSNLNYSNNYNGNIINQNNESFINYNLHNQYPSNLNREINQDRI